MKKIAAMLGVLGWVVVFVLVAQAVRRDPYRRSDPMNPFPKPDGIQSVVFRSVATETRWETPIPPEEFGMLRLLFAGARSDPSPLPWQIFGSLDVKLESGAVVRVEIFDIQQLPAGFKVGETYYRGGTSEQFMEFFREERSQQGDPQVLPESTPSASSKESAS